MFGNSYLRADQARSALDGAARHAGDDLLLEEDVAEDRRDDGDHDRGIHRDIVGRKLVGKVTDPDLDGAQLFGRNDEVGKDKFVPAGQEFKGRRRHDAGPRKRQNHVEKPAEEPAAVDIGRFLDLHRNGVHEPADEEGRDRNADRAVQ